MHRFFEEGDKVKVTLRFRGREMAHPELGMKLLQQVRTDFEPVAKVEYEPRMEGRQMVDDPGPALIAAIPDRTACAPGVTRGVFVCRDYFFLPPL